MGLMCAVGTAHSGELICRGDDEGNEMPHKMKNKIMKQGNIYGRKRREELKKSISDLRFSTDTRWDRRLRGLDLALLFCRCTQGVRVC